MDFAVVFDKFRKTDVALSAISLGSLVSPLQLVVLISRIAVDGFRLFGSEFGVKSSAWTIWLNADGVIAIGSVHDTGKPGIGIARLRSVQARASEEGVFPIFLGQCSRSYRRKGK